jgi:hypothetical protein
MAAKRISTRPKLKGNAEAEEELGKMMAHCARLERELAQLKAREAEWQRAQRELLTPRAPSVVPKRRSLRPGAPSERPTPTVPPNVLNAHAIATLREGVQSLREVLISAAGQIDAFAKKEFDLFNPKVKPLLLLRTSLLKAAGENARIPPPIPRMTNATIDISDLAEAIESLRPTSDPDSEWMEFPKPSRLGVPTE